MVSAMDASKAKAPRPVVSGDLATLFKAGAKEQQCLVQPGSLHLYLADVLFQAISWCFCSMYALVFKVD